MKESVQVEDYPSLSAVLVREGPCQSEVKLSDGRTIVVPNSHITKPQENTEMTTAKPDFASMSAAQLLVAYNAMAPKPRRVKFGTKTEGLARVETLWAATHAESKPKTKGADRKAKRYDLKIRILAKTNPRREKSRAHECFEIMRTSKTVGEYLDAAGGSDRVKRRDANLYLRADKLAKHVELVP